MVAKGLNFPDVTLVGVLNTDQMLYADDYRSYERSFSLLTQVVGRSGRGNSKGMAVIQTYTPDNLIISMAAKQDYDTFYNTEIEVRKSMLYPPFADICLIGFVGQNQTLTLKAANSFLKSLINPEQSQNPHCRPARV
jgi:primosomal protein N' (replication factor Y)